MWRRNIFIISNDVMLQMRANYTYLHYFKKFLCLLYREISLSPCLFGRILVFFYNAMFFSTEEMSSTAARSATTLSSLLANPNSANGNTSEKPVASGGSAAVVSPPNGGSSPPAPGVTMAPTADETLSSPSANKDITYEGIVNVLATSARGATVVGGESASSPPESSSPPGGVVSTTRVSTGDDETGPSSSPARFRSVGGGSGSPSMSHDALLRLKEICDMTSSVESTPTAPGPSESTPGPASYIKADPSEQPSPTSYIRADHSGEPAPVASYIQVNPSEPMAGPSKPSAPFIPDNIRSLMEQVIVQEWVISTFFGYNVISRSTDLKWIYIHIRYPVAKKDIL